MKNILMTLGTNTAGQDPIKYNLLVAFFMAATAGVSGCHSDSAQRILFVTRTTLNAVKRVAS